MSRARTLWAHVAAALVLPVAVGAPGVAEYLQREHPARLAPASAEVSAAARRPDFDPERPTVVVLLGADVTEITDALAPYEMFARAGGLNVVTAAPERRPTLLTGGLRILPHYALAEIDALLEGRAPAIVVVPNIPNIAEDANAPLLDWVRTQASAGALMHSWCTGAMVLAEAGLLDGQDATAHWGDLPWLERRYPQVHWVRGVRFIEHGQFVISAGITSGIDASLRVITRVIGPDAARRVARELRYPSFDYALDPTATQYALGGPDAVLLADAAFGWPGRSRIGLALYDGVGELDLSNVYDAHAFTMVADVEAVAAEDVVRTEHGLSVLPSIVSSRSSDRARIVELDRLVVPGPAARDAARSIVGHAASIAPRLRAEYLHADAPGRFGLEPVLEDLARTSDVATARFALRRMEYRSGDVRLEGSAQPWRSIVLALALVLTGLVALRAGLLARARTTEERRAAHGTQMAPHAPAR